MQHILEILRWFNCHPYSLGCSSTGIVVCLPKCQWSNPKRICVKWLVYSCSKFYFWQIQEQKTLCRYKKYTQHWSIAAFCWRSQGRLWGSSSWQLSWQPNHNKARQTLQNMNQVHKIGILRGYAIRSGRRPEGSQRPQGGPPGPPRPLTSRGTSAWPYRVTTQYSFYPVQICSQQDNSEALKL